MAPKKKSFPDEFWIVVIGCGGTGSALLQNLMPYLTHRAGKPVKVVLCDGDIVEEKNLTRQVFYEDQIGMNKASALAESIEATFEVTVDVCNHYLERTSDLEALFRGSWGCFPIVISCVDNLKARALYEEWFMDQTDALYVDCANEEFHGEVVYAVKHNKKLLSPVRSTVFPSFARILEQEQATLKFRSELDCLARSISAPQHIFTNKMAGLLAANAISTLLDKKQFPVGVDFFSMEQPVYLMHQDTSKLIPTRKAAAKKTPLKQTKRNKKVG